MTIEALPPGPVLIAGGLLLPWLSPTRRTALVLLLPLVVLWLVWQVPDGVAWSAEFMGYDIEPLRGDRLSRVFGTVFAIMAFVGGLFACRHARPVELASAFIYAGGALGVVFAGDLITLFAYWELMAVASTLVLWSAGTEGSRAAGMRYVVVHLLGGVILMVGVTAYAF
ncbi:MAG: Na+/H+ antiporter subunit D, partial [Gammaproteobacteria bacterium]|nr:Na+/H+ antiporter subunit D [Gammaproteobacteria bacterium]